MAIDMVELSEIAGCGASSGRKPWLRWPFSWARSANCVLGW